jgi:hypothetical protein
MLQLTVLIKVEIIRNYSHTESQSPQPFTQSELNDVVRDLGLPKVKTELVSSRLKENNLLADGTSMYWYRSRNSSLQVTDHRMVTSCNVVIFWINAKIRRRVKSE